MLNFNQRESITSPNFDIPEPIVFQNTYQQPPQMQYQHPNMYGQTFNTMPQFYYSQPYYGGESNPMMYSAKMTHPPNDIYYQQQVPPMQYGYHV